MAVNSSEEIWILLKQVSSGVQISPPTILRVHSPDFFEDVEFDGPTSKRGVGGTKYGNTISNKLKVLCEAAIQYKQMTLFLCNNGHSVIVLTDGGTTNQPSQNISHSEVPNLMENEMYLNTEPNLQNISNLNLDKATNYAPCILDGDIENGNAEIPNFKEDSIGYFKSDESLPRSLQREICLQIGGKFMQLLMNHSTELPKFFSRDKLVPERVYDTTMNRSRKYKRSSSFKSLNSRRVVLLFSVLSSMGTIILIYLTLRVRQIAEGNSNV